MEQKKINIIIISCLVILGIATGFLIDNRIVNAPGGLLTGRSGGSEATTVAVAGNGTNYQAITTYPARLERIIIGETVSTGTLTIDDAVSPSNGRVFNFGVGLTKGVYEIGLDFANGIMAEVSPSYNSIFVITPK